MDKVVGMEYCPYTNSSPPACSHDALKKRVRIEEVREHGVIMAIKIYVDDELIAHYRAIAHCGSWGLCYEAIERVSGE